MSNCRPRHFPVCRQFQRHKFITVLLFTLVGKINMRKHILDCVPGRFLTCRNTLDARELTSLAVAQFKAAFQKLSAILPNLEKKSYFELSLGEKKAIRYFEN